MATEGVAAEKINVYRQNDRADPNSKTIGKPARFPNIVGENANKDDCEIEKITMHILHDEREGTFAPVSRARLTDCAGGRIGPEGLVISAAVIITSEPETTRRP